MPDLEAQPLLDKLFAVMMDERFHYRHKWHDQDLVRLDNRCVNHQACGGYSLPDIRRMHRTTIRGDRPTIVRRKHWDDENARLIGFERRGRSLPRCWHARRESPLASRPTSSSRVRSSTSISALQPAAATTITPVCCPFHRQKHSRHPTVVAQTMAGPAASRLPTFCLRRRRGMAPPWGSLPNTFGDRGRFPRSPAVHYKASEFTWIGTRDRNSRSRIDRANREGENHRRR